MGVPWLPDAYTRTCQLCGEIWTTHRQLAKVREGRWGRSAHPTDLGLRSGMSKVTLPQAFQAADARQAAARAQREVVAAAQHCPKCGGSNYTQQTLWRLPK